LLAEPEVPDVQRPQSPRVCRSEHCDRNARVRQSWNAGRLRSLLRRRRLPTRTSYRTVWIALYVLAFQSCPNLNRLPCCSRKKEEPGSFRASKSQASLLVLTPRFRSPALSCHRHSSTDSLLGD